VKEIESYITVQNCSTPIP